MKPLVIGFYTKNTPYAAEAKLLKKSLNSHEYEHDIVGIDNRGSWQKNTQAKAEIVSMMLDTHNVPLLYLDVDAIMISPPVLLDDIDCDIAAVHYANCNDNPLLSGTVYFANTPNTRAVVDRWLWYNNEYPDTLPDGRDAWDQRTLQMAIDDVTSCHFEELPQSYTWITGMTTNLPGFETLIPTIVHTRGAARFKNAIDGKEGYAQ